MNLKDYKKEYKEKLNEFSDPFYVQDEELWAYIESMVKDILASVELPKRKKGKINNMGELVFNLFVAEQRKKHEEVLE